MNLNEQFEHEGYVVIPQLLSQEVAQHVLAKIHTQIESCARQLLVTKQEYLSVVSRWQNPSVVTDVISEEILEGLQEQMQFLFRKPFQLNRWNVIVKNDVSYDAVPCHQDIAYSPSNPYYLSTWIPLNPVGEKSGGLKVLPKSHKGPTEPAVDFWSPDFVDGVQQSQQWQSQAKSFKLNPGDAVMFHSNLWHGSDQKREVGDRYCLVLRWNTPEFVPPAIPSFPISIFGMRTCGEVTENILRCYMQLWHHDSQTLAREQVLSWWIESLTNKDMPFLYINTKDAVQALKSVLILDAAARQHNGGDAQGYVYKTLWHSLIKYLKVEGLYEHI